MNAIYAICLYIVFALALAMVFCQLFRRQARRDPFIVCRSCGMRGECHAPAGTCPSVEVEDEVRAVLDAIPQFKDI